MRALVHCLCTSRRRACTREGNHRRTWRAWTLVIVNGCVQAWTREKNVFVLSQSCMGRLVDKEVVRAIATFGKGKLPRASTCVSLRVLVDEHCLNTGITFIERKFRFHARPTVLCDQANIFVPSITSSIVENVTTQRPNCFV